MSTERSRSGARCAALAMLAAAWVSACAAPERDHERASAGQPPATLANGGASASAGASAASSGATALAGDSGQPPAAAGTAGSAVPEPSPSSGQCVNGVRVSDGSSVETGGTAPDLSKALTHATTPLPALSGGTLLALADGETVAISDPERDRLYLVNVDSGLVRPVLLDAGDEPGRLIEDGAGRVHVVLRRGGALASIDVKLGALVGRRALCPAPRGLAYQRATDQLHVACAGGELLSLPAAGGPVTRSVELERDLRDVQVGADGVILVSTFRKAEVLVLASDGSVSSRLQPGSGMVRTLNGSLHRSPAVAWRMLSLDPARDSVLLLHQTGVTDTIDSAPSGYALDGCGAVVQTGLSQLTPGEPSPAVASGLSKFPLTIDVALSPDRQKVALAVAGNAPAQGATLAELSIAAAPAMTGSTCMDTPVNEIQTPPIGQVVAVSYGPSGVLFAQTREPTALFRSDSGALTILANDERSDTGHFVFHANSGGGIACASCHPEGGEDGRVWDFICAGPRRTQSLRGGIAATAPFHWDGSELDMGRLLEDVFTNRMAGPLLDEDVKKAVQTWVDTIPELPPLNALDPPSVARGKALFEAASPGCSTCHASAQLTNNSTVDVGTGRAFQVPSLRGVAFRAPFMHNGCAQSLRDRFVSTSCGGGERHGASSSLTGAQIDDLIAYLESL